MPEFQEAKEADSGWDKENQNEHPHHKLVITLISEFKNNVKGMPNKDARDRKLALFLFHGLVRILARKHETMEKEDDPKIVKVFDNASDRMEFFGENLPNNHLGFVPGVNVGDIFQSRRLLRMVCLHGPL